MRFFSNDPNGNGFEEHATADEAQSAAHSALNQEIDGDFFDEDAVLGICWGEIRERVVIKDKRGLTTEEKEEHPEWDFYVEAELRPAVDPETSK